MENGNMIKEIKYIFFRNILKTLKKYIIYILIMIWISKRLVIVIHLLICFSLNFCSFLIYIYDIKTFLV